MTRAWRVIGALTVVVVALSGWLWVRGGDGGDRREPAIAPANTQVATTLAPSTVVLVAEPPSAALASATAVAAEVVALDERRMVGVDEARELTAEVAAPSSRQALVAQAVRQAERLRTEVGDVVVLSHPLRTRTISSSESSAVVDVWWVKVIVGAHRASAGDVWGTTRITLALSDGRWLVVDERSRLGPWPTHSADAVAHPSGAVFAAALEGFVPIEVTP